MRGRLAEEGAKQARLMRAFRDPRLLIASSQQRIDDLMYRLTSFVHRRVSQAKDHIGRQTTQLRAQHPHVRIARDRARASELDARLIAAAKHALRADAERVGRLAGRLDAMSPLKVLSRGYAIVTKDGHAVRRATEVAPGDQVHVRVGEGAFDAEVKG
jgi:exodeoxyribonuclease VII large subunit